MRWLLPAAAVAMLTSCNPAPTAEQMALTEGGRLEVYFNDPGTRRDNMWEPDAVDVMIEVVNSAQDSISFSVMGFGRQPLIDALIAAYDRGIDVRMVGDAGHLYNSGYQQFIDREIPIVTGNSQHIMHNKFMIVDNRFVMLATANWTDTDLRHNSNNFIFMDSPLVAEDFQAEFEQMFDGRFGNTKTELFNGRKYQVGDTSVEVWFAPKEDTMGRMIEVIDEAKESLRFTIFAFTKDQVGSAFIRKQEEFELLNATDGGAQNPNDDQRIFDERTVAGVIDQSQLHSNGQYHETYRLLAEGIPLRMDGNDNGKMPGDYQAGGGRLHSKTMVMDAYGDDPTVITGSFNWSASATVSNDEFLLVMKGARVAQEYDRYFRRLWADGRTAGGDRVSDGSVNPGDLVINEVMWYGVNSGDDEGFDEFIELRNTTDRELNLDLWSISNPDDFVVGLPPGSVVEPGGTFTIVDHTTEQYVDGAPQDAQSAFQNADLVLNAFNDNRQARLYIKDGVFELFLRDPNGELIDTAGDGGAAFFGGPEGGKKYSMERKANPGDGTDPSNWQRCQNSEGGANVTPKYKSEIVATPDEPNSK